VPLLEVRDLAYTYPTGIPALRGVSFAIDAGDVVGLLGPNGAGKSTLILHLNGILPGRGRVTVHGEPVGKTNLAQVRRTVGLVFQNPDDQLFMPTVFDDVAFGPLNLGLGETEVRERVARALEAVGMAGFEDRAPYHLSTGQKKRVALATVLVLDAEVLVLDEPTSGLDPRGRREFMNLLRELPCAKLVATHDLALAAELCSRVVILDAGVVVAQGPAGEILSDAALLEAHGLERPR